MKIPGGVVVKVQRTLAAPAGASVKTFSVQLTAEGIAFGVQVQNSNGGTDTIAALLDPAAMAQLLAPVRNFIKGQR